MTQSRMFHFSLQRCNQHIKLRTNFPQCDRISQDRSRDDAPGCLHRLLTCLHAQPLPLIVFMCGVEILNDPVQRLTFGF